MNFKNVRYQSASNTRSYILQRWRSTAQTYFIPRRTHEAACSSCIMQISLYLPLNPFVRILTRLPRRTETRPRFYVSSRTLRGNIPGDDICARLYVQNCRTVFCICVCACVCVYVRARVRGFATRSQIISEWSASPTFPLIKIVKIEYS